MIANSLLTTIALFMAVGFWLLGELKFFVPYKPLILHQYGSTILAWLAIAFANAFAGIYALQRKFFLKDTGQKLSHIDTQARVGDSPIPHPHDWNRRVS